MRTFPKGLRDIIPERRRLPSGWAAGYPFSWSCSGPSSCSRLLFKIKVTILLSIDISIYLSIKSRPSSTKSSVFMLIDIYTIYNAYIFFQLLLFIIQEVIRRQFGVSYVYIKFWQIYTESILYYNQSR